ncbi:phosphatidylinositol kinase [Phytophthora cinnamomi]|uniref:phosphatidylinositol kinase n=1 Tax=Phytophthora cinnamomi TaxID=4785 RepID=UPI0035595792|nr:phosphatidylinositol kinase [Phytophthora cinnamomi]
MPHDAQDVAAPPFNPLVALQTLLAADAAGAKQRVRAAQQLQSYFALLAPTPGLLLSYEPYLPLLTELLQGEELQAAVLAMLLALSAHNPAGFSDWMARHAQLGNEPWLVQWSYALLLQAEKAAPRREEEDDDKDAWDENSPQFREFDAVFARVLHMWRTMLDHTADVALVDQLVKYLHALLVQQQEDGQRWSAMVLKKLQTHFVDIADVLIGWMMSTGPHGSLRDEILTLLHHFGRLWADNSVFSLQLLNSFADEIVNLCDSWTDHQEGDDDRVSTLLTCFMMVAQCVPDLALPAEENLKSPFVRVLRRVASCSEPEYSISCLANCSEYMCPEGTGYPSSSACKQSTWRKGK